MQQKPLVIWADTDSVAIDLRNRAGFRVTRYQGDHVLFEAQRKALRMIGKPAAVGRDQTLVVGDTVIYNDSTKVIVALGDTVVLHDPTQNSADVISRGKVAYDITHRRASVNNISTSVQSGETYYISGRTATFIGDTSAAKRSAFYIRNGIITSCDDSMPDYYFKAGEIKYLSKSLIIARPAVLYVVGVPVFWLPFLFQDIRRGRRSGILPPRLGLSEFLRTNAGYRRHIENLGYYANLGNYMDAIAWIDWRSGARPDIGDPGFLRMNADFKYRWLDRFITGQFAASQQRERNGGRNTAVSWSHFEDFSQSSRLSSSINYVTNTTLQRSYALDPRVVFQTIRSDVRYSRQVGPFAFDVGGTRTQYPGRSQVDENYPSLSLSSPTIGLTRWLDWTPGFSYSRSATRNNDALGALNYRYFITNGAPDSARVKSSTNASQVNFNTPFIIHGFQINANVNAQHNANNYPLTRTFVNQTDPTQRYLRTFARSYTDAFDWNVGFSLPSVLNGSFRIRPDISLTNVIGGSYWVRSELSRGQFVHQSKRVSGGLSASPTLFGIFPGVGPVASIRHSISPTFSYRYAPSGHVSNDYLLALNQDPSHFLGNLQQSQLIFQLSQIFEAKLRSDTGASSEGRKIKLLSLNFSSLTYDFERARKTHRTGLVTDRLGYDLSSDLLPGFSLRANYSLFQGSISSDTARFSPYRESLDASFRLNGQSGVFAAVSRLFGHAVSTTSVAPPSTNPDTVLAQHMASLPVAGNAVANRRYEIPETGTWTSAITFSSSRQRPPKGGRVLAFDPNTYCNAYLGNPLIHDQCLQNVLLNPVTAVPNTDLIAGGAFITIPERTTIQSQSTFHITPKWAASWGTAYDVVRKQFANHQVTLQRDLHDWRAVFAFTTSPNGNSFFNFSIINKAQSELQFPYNKSTYRPQDVR